MRMRLIVITSPEGLLPYRLAWDNILESCDNTNPFIEFNWVWTWWNYFGLNQVVEVFVVEQDGEAIAFFPVVCQKKWYADVYFSLAFGQANYMDIVVRKEHLSESIAFIFDGLVHTGGRKIFYLHGLLESGATPATLEAYLKRNSLYFSVHRVVTPWVNLLEMDLNNFLKKRKTLHGMDRREKRLKKIGTVTLAESDPNEMNLIFDLHDKRWKEKNDTSGFTDVSNRKLYQNLALLKEGPMTTDIYALYLESRMIAFTYGFTCRGRYVVYTLGHDDDFDTFGPGRLLMREMIQAFHQSQVYKFDLSIGYEPYKFDWNTNVDQTRKMIFASKGVISSTIRLLFTAKETIIGRMKQHYRFVLFKRNTIGKVKSILRSNSYRTLFSRGKQAAIDLLTRKSYSIFKLDMDCITEEGEKIFVGLPVQQLFRKNDIQLQQPTKVLIKRLFNGFTGFHLGDQDETLLWVHQRIIKIDAISYIENLPKNSLFLDDWKPANVVEFCVFIKRQMPAITHIYLAVLNLDKAMAEFLADAGFSLEKRIGPKNITQKKDPSKSRIGSKGREA